MNTLRLRRDYEDSAVHLKGEFADPSDVDLFVNKNTIVLAPDGSLQAILIRDVIPRNEHLLAYELWKNVNGDLSNRPDAVGVESTHRSKNAIGELSPRNGVHADVVTVLREQGVRQGIIGYLDGSGCRKTALTVKHPEMLRGNRSLIERMDRTYAEHAPEFYAIQRAEVAKVPAWRLWGTAFSTVYVVKQLKAAGYHRDTGNLTGALTAITPCGEFTGGELVLLRWRIAIAHKPGDVLLFDAEQLHANLPFEGHRLSAAMYCEQHIGKCEG
jgi:hypothetical protein